MKSLQYGFVGATDNFAAYDSVSDSARRRILTTPRKKTLTIGFTRYRFDNMSKEIYDENNYIFYEDQKYKPVSKYNDYTLYYNRSKK